MKVKIVNKSNNELPNYATLHAAGMDLRAFITDDIKINSLERKMIPTGIYVEIPVGYEAQVRPRSGLAIKNGIMVINTPGTVDADYRGEICLLLINLSNETFIIHNGDRLAQMIVSKHETVEWELVEELSETERGDGGFGHTGHK